MIVKTVQTFYGYNAWANNQILDATAKLSNDQFLAGVGASFDSVRDTLVHTMGGQGLWLSRWKGAPWDSMPDPMQFPDLDAIRVRWDEIEQETVQFVDGLSTHQLTEIIKYVNTEGEPWQYPLWQLMLHQVNHATQHRSEVAVMLTHFGHSPGGLDFLYYVNL